MSYRLIDSNAIAVKYPEVNNMPCIFVDLPNGLDGQHYDLRKDYRPHGEWEHWGSPFSDESEVIDTIVCSVCGARFIEPKDEPKWEYNYCPSCGALMGGEDE